MVTQSHQSILKEINLEYSLEGLMLKLQYFGHLMPRADSLEKSLMLGKNEGRRKASGGDGIPIELFQILKDDAVIVLYSICQQIWKTQQ